MLLWVGIVLFLNISFIGVIFFRVIALRRHRKFFKIFLPTNLVLMVTSAKVRHSAAGRTGAIWFHEICFIKMAVFSLPFIWEFESLQFDLSRKQEGPKIKIVVVMWWYYADAVMVNYCLVGRCRSRADKVTGISVHRFPKNSIIRKQLLKFVQKTRSKFDEPKEASSAGICSQHFTYADFIVPPTIGKSTTFHAR